jgi:dipeptidyl-peptidase 4
MDAGALTYLHAARGSNVRSLWRHDLATGIRHRLARAPAPARHTETLTIDEELLRQRQHESGLGLTDYTASEHADVLVAVAAGCCLVSRDGAAARQLRGWSGVQAAIPSPDGGRLALVVAGDLWVTGHDGDNPVLITNDAAPGRFNGLPEFVAAEELDRFTGAWWSADGETLAWARVDETAVPEFAVGTDPARSVAERHRYPFAGAANASVSLWHCRPGSERPTSPASLGIEDGYLARVLAHPRGGWLVAVLPRDQRSLRWWRLDPPRPPVQLWEERCDPWVTLDDATHVLADGRVLRATETTGFRHLELRHPDGTLERRLTSGSWVVTGLVHVDEARGEALFLGTADGVLERHLYAVRLDAPRPEQRPPRLTPEPGWHEVVIARDGTRWVDTFSTRERAPAVMVRSRDGAAPILVRPPSATAATLRASVPELVDFTAADGSTALHGALFRPRRGRRAAADPLPAVVWVYGGPHSQHVRESWELTANPLRQALAAAGLAVVMVDGRGTANRGVDFAAGLNRAFGTVELDDQVAMVDQLAARHEIDPHRIAITGWSYGGYMTVRAMERRGDLFRAGVAGAPVVAWEGYDTAYTERYLDEPAREPDAYRRASLLPEAARISGPLLLIHGTLDENVHPRHSHWLLAALAEAGRPVDVEWLEGQRHRLQGPGPLNRRNRTTVEYLCHALGLSPPNEETAPRTRQPAVRPPRTAG